MKIIKKYILSSLLRILIFTVLLTSLLLMNVDLFSNFNSYVQNNVSWFNIFLITIKYFPQAIITVFPPATLFTITFFLSQMYSNNEIIAFLSSGISIHYIYRQIVLLLLGVSILLFIFNENFVLQSRIDYEQMKNEILNINNELDNSNIGLIDSLNNNIIYANRYVDKDKALYQVIIIEQDEDGNIISRIDSPKATWSDVNNDWLLSDVTISNIEENAVIVNKYDSYEDKSINLDYNMFRNLSADLQTMFLPSAIKYLRIQKQVNLRLWYENESDFLDRLLAPFAALIMAIIACSIDYKGRKNVFLFSIFNSIILAVVFYVSKMVFQLTAKQAIINPFVASLIPYVIIILVTLLLNNVMPILIQRNS